MDEDKLHSGYLQYIEKVEYISKDEYIKGRKNLYVENLLEKVFAVKPEIKYLLEKSLRETTFVSVSTQTEECHRTERKRKKKRRKRGKKKKRNNIFVVEESFCDDLLQL